MKKEPDFFAVLFFVTGIPHWFPDFLVKYLREVHRDNGIESTSLYLHGKGSDAFAKGSAIHRLCLLL